jgi:hypothetical protein
MKVNVKLNNTEDPFLSSKNIEDQIRMLSLSLLCSHIKLEIVDLILYILSHLHLHTRSLLPFSLLFKGRTNRVRSPWNYLLDFVLFYL